MRCAFTLLLATFLAVPGFGQCVNGYQRLLPEPSPDFSLDFGRSVSMFDKYLAVGVPDSDTVGRSSGIVYIYEKENDAWKKIASMIPSQPIPDLGLGFNVKLSDNYLLASAAANGGQVFIFKKPAQGWTSATELTVLATSGTEAFGTGFPNTIDISADENTIVVADPKKRHNFNPTSIAGSLFVYHKDGAAPWTDQFSPAEIKATVDMIDLGRAGVHISENRIITGTPFTATGTGNVLIYHDPSGNFSNLSLEAVLSPPPNYTAWMNNLVLIEDGIMWSASGGGGLQLMYFQKPAGGLWADAVATCLTDPDQNAFGNANFIHLATNGKDVFATSKTVIGTTYLTFLKKGFNGWCTPVLQTIDQNPLTFNPYGQVIAANQHSDVVSGYLPHPHNQAVANALRTYSRTLLDTWVPATLFPVGASTRNHAYGTSMAKHGDFLFVSAIRDNTLKANTGKVYVYKKSGVQWNEVSSIMPYPNNYTNPEFGTALAANKNFVAIGSQNWGSAGRFFIYESANGEWDNPQFFQEILMPGAQEDILAYGDNVAMDDRWLLIPYGDYSGNSPQVMVAIFEYSSSTWIFRQSVETGYFNIFDKSATVGIAIEGSTFVARGKIFELNANNTWINTCELTPTDPENLRFAYPTFELVQNGSDFGQTVAIRNNTIFIGAPRKDFESTWDVGAVYIYKKQPGEPWSDRTESFKLLPDVKQQSGLFGRSIFPVENEVLIGAPVDQFFAGSNLNGAVPTNIPGKVMMFRAGNSQWSSAQLSKTFTGTMSVRDNFGIAVAMDDNHIYMASSEEDIGTGFRAGTVFITNIPPLLNPIPAICRDTGSPVRLSAVPAGGTWSGRGITDTTLGTFDPNVADTGIHLITYTEPGCMATATLSIKVETKPSATLRSGEEHVVCQASDFYIPLEVVPVDDVRYEWSFRQSADVPFQPLGSTNPIATATQRGEYRVKAYNESCEEFSDIITIRNETVDIQVDPQITLCGTPPDGLKLNAVPSGGTWSGTGVRDNAFFIDGIADGSYYAFYNYQSPLGCLYQNRTEVNVQHVPAPVIHREGHLCQDGSVLLSVTGEPVVDATYSWSKAEGNGGSYSHQSIGTTLATESWGTYLLTFKKDYCEAVSQAFQIADNFDMTLTPEAPNSEICHGEDFTFGLPSDAHAQYQWFYSSDNKSPEVVIESSNLLLPAKSGYYFATIQKGVCSLTTDPRYIFIHPKDSLYVPNVFTPNGDGKNETFQITVVSVNNGNRAAYSIFNRYGQQIFSAPDNHAWDGGDANSGIYFWLGTYNTCNGQPRTIKGWVELSK